MGIKRRSIELHIEELVVPNRSPFNTDEFGDALKGNLGVQLRDHGATGRMSTSRHIGHLSGELSLASNATTHDVAAQVAQLIQRQLEK